MKQQSPMLRLWELGEGQQGGLKRAVLSAVVGVLFGMLPYFAAAQIILGLLKGEQSMQYYLIWCVVALVGFLLRATLYSLALSQSHKATFAILKSIRERVLEKLPKMPLGTILDTSSGQMKQIIVDQVESMERPLAHLLPEMTANVLGPVCILIYLFVLDWRMALLSLVSIPVGMAFMMAVMAGYGKQYEGSVKTTQAMNSAIVEYIGGIEVIKAFNQGKQSYARFSDSVKANASYFYHWMKSCQMPVSLARAISPTTMITILPVGWLLYTGGSLPIETFITTIVLSLGIAGPLLAAMDFVDSLAKVGTIVGSVDAILNGAEQDHGEASVEFRGRDIKLSHVSFGYHADKEVLHDVSLTIPAGSMTAFVGPSGSGKSTIAKEIARQLGFNKLDTGAMYRAVTFAALDRGIDLDNEAAIDALAEQIEIRFTNGTGEDTRLTIDGKDASAAIRTPQVDANVSKVSAYPGVRAAMLIHQRRAAEDRDIVAEGRDIGTVVFPNAQVKVFLTADPRERARRRVLQRHQNDAQPLTTEQLETEVDETLDALKQRDKLDSSREVAPLVPAEDAVHVDSTAHTIDEVVRIIEDLINQRR